MIVLVIVSLLATAFTLQISDRRSSDDEVERLRRVLEAAAERAQIRGTPLAVDFAPQTYRVSSYDTGGTWTPLRGEPLFAEQSVPDLVWAGLSIDGQASPPRLVFGSEMPDFVLAIRSGDKEIRLAGEPTGAVVRLPPGPG